MPPSNKRKATGESVLPPKKHREAAGANPPKRKSKPGLEPLSAARPPNNASSINIQNRLHVPAIRETEHRPWFLYDQIQPVAMFRHMPEDYDWVGTRKETHVSEGDESEVLSESMDADTKPVVIPGYV